MTSLPDLIGTATTVLRLGPFTLLTDPNFIRRGQRVHLGYGLTLEAPAPIPALASGELPLLDALVLSHLHGDHFDRVARRELPRRTAGRHHRQAARTAAEVGLHRRPGSTTGTFWDTASAATSALRVTAVPGQHGPAGVHRLLPPVIGTRPRPGHRRRAGAVPCASTSPATR